MSKTVQKPDMPAPLRPADLVRRRRMARGVSLTILIASCSCAAWIMSHLDYTELNNVLNVPLTAPQCGPEREMTQRLAVLIAFSAIVLVGGGIVAVSQWNKFCPIAQDDYWTLNAHFDSAPELGPFRAAVVAMGQEFNRADLDAIVRYRGAQRAWQGAQAEHAQAQVQRRKLYRPGQIERE